MYLSQEASHPFAAGIGVCRFAMDTSTIMTPAVSRPLGNTPWDLLSSRALSTQTTYMLFILSASIKARSKTRWRVLMISIPTSTTTLTFGGYPISFKVLPPDLSSCRSISNRPLHDFKLITSPSSGVALAGKVVGCLCYSVI